MFNKRCVVPALHSSTYGVSLLDYQFRTVTRVQRINRKLRKYRNDKIQAEQSFSKNDGKTPNT